MNIEEIDSNFPNNKDNVFGNNTDSPKFLFKCLDSSSEDNPYYYNYFDSSFVPLNSKVGLSAFNSNDSSTNSQSSAAKKNEENQENPKINEINSSPSKLFKEENQIAGDKSDNKSQDKNKEAIFGRPSKDNPRKGKHTRKSKDNGIKVIITSCVRSMHNSLQKEIKAFIGKKKDKNGRIIKSQLHVPTINKYLIKGNKEKLLLFNSPIKEIYYNTLPKRVKNKIKNEKEKYSYNKDVLNNILNIEEENDQIELKQLNVKFNAEFKIYLDAYLKNRKNITVNGINFELNEEFKTLKDCFNEGENSYTKKEKEEFKKHLIEMIGKKSGNKLKKVNKEIKYILIKLNDY